MTPALCPLCLAKNIVASDNGPTCSHVTTGSWWPEWWNTGGEVQRLVWLEARKQKNKPSR